MQIRFKNFYYHLIASSEEATHRDEKQIYKQLNLKKTFSSSTLQLHPQFPHLLNGDNNNLCIFTLGSK